VNEPNEQEPADDAETFGHIPVMVDTVMEFLQPERGGPYWDLTLGGGGHLGAWLQRSPDEHAFGLDGDPGALVRAGHLPATLVHADLSRIAEVASEHNWPAPNGILMDLGLSSPQVDDASRGFSFRNDGPLDMRMDPTRGDTAAEWLIDVEQDELTRVIRELGEERFAGRIARTIKESLPIDTTDQLTRAILKAVGKRPRRHHPARRTFQGIRMAVNQELEKIEAGLLASMDLLAPGGRLVVISFHSGEDRVVKHTFRTASRREGATMKLLTKRPQRCTDLEAEQNPRARSALVRAIERIAV
jgi:16S rRNA (cytosine1402-N4)-methyltransferase